MSGGNATHYLRHNHQTRQSRRHVFLDTEARTTYHQPVQSQSWLLGVARFMDLDPRRKSPLDTTTEYVDEHTLWGDVDKFTRSGTRTVLWCHNLAYDLRIARGLEILPDLGWNLQAIVLDGLASWAKFTRDKRTLVCADFLSWASMPLARIASLLGMAQEPLPEIPERDLRGTFRRCRQDVNILCAAVVSTLDWLKTDDLGNQQITGPAQAFSAYRHRFMQHQILVHGRPDLLKRERRAIWAGRTEAWRHGIFVNDDVHEFDLQRAYANVARDCQLPTVYVGMVDGADCTPERIAEWAGNNRAILAGCTVNTPKPVVPTEHDGRVLWPTGQFRTTLWDTELRALTNVDADVTIHRADVYTSAPCLRTWAEWILTELNPDTGTTPPLQTRILKQWSRSLIGRFALQYRAWDKLGESEESDLYLADLCGEDVEHGAQLLQAGHTILQLGSMVDGENCLPQITGYITAVCRMRLWELMNVAGLENVYYVDTDSIMCNGMGARNLRRRMDLDGAYGLAYKHAIGRLELQGPRQLTVDTDRRYSGVPRGARAQATATANVVTGEVWEGIGESLRNHRPASVQVVERDFTLQGNDRRRVHLPDGRTAAYELGTVPSALALAS